MPNKPAWLKIYSVFFLVFVMVMLLGQIFVPGRDLNSLSENYLWKKSLIEKFNHIKYEIGDRVFSNILIGKDGWLFYSGDMSLRDYQKVDPLKAGEIKQLAQILIRIKNQTEQYGGSFVLVVAPDKSTIYPQYMPDELPVIGSVSSMDRLFEYFSGHNSGIQMVDLRPVFSQVSTQNKIYYKTDTHWNCLGAFYAANQILETSLYPRFTPYSLADFKFGSASSLKDMPRILGLNIKEDSINANSKLGTHVFEIPSDITGYTGTSVKIKVNMEQNLPDILILHDSFYEACLDDFIEPNFSRIVSMPYRDGVLTDYLDLIASEKPDIVIIEFVERYMDYLYLHLSK